MADNLLTQDEINALLGIKDETPQKSSSEKKTFKEEKEPGFSGESSPNLELIMDFPLTLSVHLGKSRKNLQEVRRISPGAVLELDRFINEPLDILINNKLIAKGEVVVVDESFGIKITQILNPIERIRKLG